jgi:hypothetical protein
MRKAKFGQYCGNCGKVMGVQGKTWWLLVEARHNLHQFRYYTRRGGWTCRAMDARREATP